MKLVLSVSVWSAIEVLSILRIQSLSIFRRIRIFMRVTP